MLCLSDDGLAHSMKQAAYKTLVNSCHGWNSLSSFKVRGVNWYTCTLRYPTKGSYKC